MITHLNPINLSKMDDLRELYISVVVRSLANSMSGIFIPVFLFTIGYPVWQIMTYYALAFTSQYIFGIPIAKSVAKIGPKHTILISYIIQVFSMIGLVYLKYEPNIFIASALLLGLGNIMFFLPYHVDFSKVKHKKTGGKELGVAYLLERFGAVLGPIAGGLIAYFFGAEYIFVASLVILLIAVVPLLMSAEPTRLNQKLHYEDFRLKDIKDDLISYGSFTIEAATSITIWPLFVAIFVFGKNPYLKLGLVMSVSIIISLLAVRLYARLIDHNNGRTALRVSSVLNGLLHLVRVASNSFTSVLAINIANEAVTPGYRVAYFKGMYVAADGFEGHRIVYISIMEVVSSLVRSIFFAVASIVSYYISADRPFFAFIFIIGAIASFMIMTEKYKGLNSKEFRLWPKRV